MPEKRHRLNEQEVHIIIEGIELLLEKQLKTRDDPEKAKVAFRLLNKFIFERTGRPKYPESDWESIHDFINIYFTT